MNKKTILAASLSLALVAPGAAFAAFGAKFDPDGAGAAGSSLINKFDWDVGNTFIQDTNPFTGSEVRDSVILVQAHISSLTNSGGGATTLPGGNYDLTFQLQVLADHSLLGGTTHGWSDIGDRDDDLSGFRDGDEDADPFAGGDLTSFFRVYQSNTAASLHDLNSGLGFGDDNNDGDILDDGITSSGDTGKESDEKLILEGLVNIKQMTFTDNSSFRPNKILDGNGNDQQNDVQTIVGTGSALFEIDIRFADSDYFLTDITSLLLDINLDGSNSLNFSTTNPTDYVVGQHTDDADLAAAARKTLNETSYGDDTDGNGDLVNNFDCGTLATCGFHLQSDTSSVVQGHQVPEPGSLALLGMGMLAFGAGYRKNRRS